ncbi:MAG: hypothetical protein WBM61_03775 [Woeseiaceae bacterium]
MTSGLTRVAALGTVNIHVAGVFPCHEVLASAVRGISYKRIYAA